MLLIRTSHADERFDPTVKDAARGQGFPEALRVGFALLPLKPWGRGGLIVPNRRGFRPSLQCFKKKKNPTQNLGHNRKLNPTVTLKKGNSVTAWDISVLSVCHRGSTCFGEIFLHVYFMLEHFPLPREKYEGAKICCQPQVSFPMFYVLLVLMGNHTIPELVVTLRNSNTVQITARMFREQNVPPLADGCSPHCPIITT